MRALLILKRGETDKLLLVLAENHTNKHCFAFVDNCAMADKIHKALHRECFLLLIRFLLFTPPFVQRSF